MWELIQTTNCAENGEMWELIQKGDRHEMWELLLNFKELTKFEYAFGAIDTSWNRKRKEQKKNRMNLKKYLIGLAIQILILTSVYEFYYPDRKFLSGSILALFLLVPFYLLKILVILKYPEKGVGIQMGIMTASFFCNGIGLWAAVSQNDSSDLIIGFFIAHFSHFLIVVFAS